MAAALQLQRDAGLMASVIQVLGQYVMSLNRMSSQVLHLALVPRVHCVATQMAAMGLWRPPVGPSDPGPTHVSSCSNCLGCTDCAPGPSG